jgi:hypothetical protein
MVLETMEEIMKSLHEEHGKDAVKVLQGGMKANLTMPKGFEVTDSGNHFIIKKDGKEMKVGLFAAHQVFEALNLFS